MNILFSSLAGQNQTQSLELRHVLQRLGHSIFFLPTPTSTAGPRPRFWIERGFVDDIALEALIAEAPLPSDLFLYVEPRGLIPRGMEKSPIPTACILCDTHLWLEARQHLARFFDHVFLYHRNYLVHFSEHPAGHVHWLPYACDLEVFKPVGMTRDLEVAFVGQPMLATTRRAAIIQQLEARYRVNEQRYHLREEIPAVYARAKIVLNMPLKDDLNFRTFEAMSCGALLLTRRVNNGQEILFQEGVHFAAYADEKEMFEKIDHYLTHEAEREAIAAAGLAEVQAHHRLEQRISEMLENIAAAPDLAAPIRRMTPAQVDREYAWLYEYWRSPEPGLRLVREARLTGRQWLPLLPPAIRSVLRMLFR
ncbi:MAG: glycosyltransferase [Chloroflexota bacterium]